MVLFFSTTDSSGQTKIRALLVEDDLGSRTAMARILEMLGYDVTGVTTVAEGIKAVEHLPDCLILDLMLPDGNGMEILRHIRQQALPIRVAVLTGADRPMIEDARRLAPDALFTKPVDLTKLLSWMQAA